MSRDSVLKGQTSHINYERTLDPIGLKLGVYLSREVLCGKFDMTSSRRHQLIFYDLLQFWVIKFLFTKSSELHINKISENFFLINLEHAT